MPENLAGFLRQMRIDALICQAETVRDWPSNADRIAEAMTHIREAMLQCTIGRITQEEKYHIISILHFAMPSDAPSADEHPPVDPDEKPPAQIEEQVPFDPACFLGCPTCDEGGRMVDD